MAMPEGYDGMRTGDESERTDDPNEYKRTCIDFIEDISHDYEGDCTFPTMSLFS